MHSSQGISSTSCGSEQVRLRAAYDVFEVSGFLEGVEMVLNFPEEIEGSLSTLILINIAIKQLHRHVRNTDEMKEYKLNGTPPIINHKGVCVRSG